jgi:glycosyltransferase involved in cell wall biosynthesis
MDSLPEPVPAPALSVVVPLHDEAGSVEELVRRVRAVGEASGLGWELVMVDDGSADGTAERLRALASADPRLRVLATRRRRGQTTALKAGLARARGEVLVTMDGDLQNAPEDIPLLLQALNEGADVVIGWRRDRRDPFFSRRLPSLVANRWIRRLTGIEVHDHGCALKAYRRELVREMHLYGDHHRLVTALTALHGARVREVVVSHAPRREGRSKYGGGRVLRVLADVFAIHLLLRHRRRPSVWFLKLALPLVLGAVGATGVAVWSALRWPAASLVVWVGAAFILGFGASSLVATGLFAELLLRLEPLHLRAGGVPLRRVGGPGSAGRPGGSV